MRTGFVVSILFSQLLVVSSLSQALAGPCVAPPLTDQAIADFKANPKAVNDVEEFKKTIDSFSAPNPFLKDSSAALHYVGTTSFGQKRQLAVPLVVNEYKDGKFQTLFVANVD